MEILYRLSVSKINGAIALLSEIRDLANSFLLRTIYFAIFESYLNYCSIVWSQIVILQKKLLELLTFSHVILTLVLYSKKFCLNS